MNEPNSNDLVDVLKQARRSQPEFQRQLQIQLEVFVRKYNIAVESLTEKQLAEAIRQAIACGDFVRQVRVTDNAQAVAYVPFAEAESFGTRIHKLESEHARLVWILVKKLGGEVRLMDLDVPEDWKLITREDIATSETVLTALSELPKNSIKENEPSQNDTR